MVSVDTPRHPRKAGRALRMLRSPHLALAAAVLFWSGNFIVGRAFRGEISPVSLNFARWVLAFSVLAPFVARDVIAARAAILREWRLILLLGCTGIASFHTIVYLALLQTTALNALVCLSLAPAAILAGSALIGQSRLTMAQAIGTAVSTTGLGSSTHRIN